MNEHIIQFFAYSHLPAPLQEVSQPFSAMAQRIVDTIPRNPERTVALRKLLESKDAAVRALLAKEMQPEPQPQTFAGVTTTAGAVGFAGPNNAGCAVPPAGNWQSGTINAPVGNIGGPAR